MTELNQSHITGPGLCPAFGGLLDSQRLGGHLWSSVLTLCPPRLLQRWCLAESRLGTAGSCPPRPQAPLLTSGRAVFLGSWGPAGVGGGLPAQGIGTEGSAPESPDSCKGFISILPLTPPTPPEAKDSAQQITVGREHPVPMLWCVSLQEAPPSLSCTAPLRHPGVLTFWAKAHGKSG